MVTLPDDLWLLIATLCTPQALLAISSLTRDLARELRVRMSSGERIADGRVNLVDSGEHICIRDMHCCAILLLREVSGVTALNSKFLLHNGCVRSFVSQDSAIKCTSCVCSLANVRVHNLGSVGHAAYGLNIHGSCVNMHRVFVCLDGPGACVRARSCELEISRSRFSKSLSSLSATIVLTNTSVNSHQSIYEGRVGLHLDLNSRFSGKKNVCMVRDEEITQAVLFTTPRSLG